MEKGKKIRMERGVGVSVGKGFALRRGEKGNEIKYN